MFSAAVAYLEQVREVELWARLDQALGATYAKYWAAHTVIAELDGRTVVEALAAGMPAKTVWRAVWAFLELPHKDY